MEFCYWYSALSLFLILNQLIRTAIHYRIQCSKFTLKAPPHWNRNILCGYVVSLVKQVSPRFSTGDEEGTQSFYCNGGTHSLCDDPPFPRYWLHVITTDNCYTQCTGGQIWRCVFEQFRITWRCPHDFIVFPHRLGGKTKTISQQPLSDLVQKCTCCTVLIIHCIQTSNV